MPTASNASTTIAAIAGTASQSGEYLYVWAGADGRKVSDRLVTLDYNRNSRTYGSMVSYTMLPAGNDLGNEPHHCGMSSDGKTLLCGGLLSLLNNQQSIFRYDLSNPAMPTLVGMTSGKLGGVPDEFYALGDNSFLLTEMGSAAGGSPGRVAHLDNQGNVIAEYPEGDTPDGFNPHGLDIRDDLNLMITCDYVDPGSTLNSSPGGVILRSSVRVWDYNAKTISSTIDLTSGTGSMDCKLMKKDAKGRGFVGGSGNGQIFMFDPSTGNATQVINMNNDILPDSLKSVYTILAQYMQVSDDDRRMYVPYISDFASNNRNAFYSGLATYDITNPLKPVLLQNKAFPAYAGPHLCHIIAGRLVITDYFLDEDDFGRIHFNGDHFIRVFNLDSNGLPVESGKGVDSNNLFPDLDLRPHGVAYHKG